MVSEGCAAENSWDQQEKQAAESCLCAVPSFKKRFNWIRYKGAPEELVSTACSFAFPGFRLFHLKI